MLNREDCNKIIKKYSYTYGIKTYADVIRFLQKHNITELMPNIYSDNINNTMAFRITTIKKGMYELEAIELPFPISIFDSITFYN
ncbi:MAG: hypothetical protein IKY94_09860 [Lachnospiraceae bacterium]|nr:hypothetical protein [Lachnospiraceae bacterium]MBR5191306.1 hypothetical protein [Clostridia bacterium]